MFPSSISNPNAPDWRNRLSTFKVSDPTPLAATVGVTTILYKMTQGSTSEPWRRSLRLLGPTMALQLVIQREVEQYMSKKDHRLVPAVCAAATAGGVSTPILMKFSFPRKPMTLKNISLIFCRETAFLLSLRVSGPLSEVLEEFYGKNKQLEYGSTFFCAALGRLWVDSFKAFSSPGKLLALGGLSVFYKYVTDIEI